MAGRQWVFFALSTFHKTERRKEQLLCVGAGGLMQDLKRCRTRCDLFI